MANRALAAFRSIRDRAGRRGDQRPVAQLAEAALTELRSGGNVPPEALTRALEALVTGEVTMEEQAWFDRIERLRAGLLSSTETVRFQTREKDVPVGDICLDASVTPDWGRFLFRLVRETKPSMCLELGTSLALSASYQAAALDLNGKGRLVTVEVSEPLSLIASANLHRLGASRAEVRLGRFQDVLEPLLSEIAPIDFAFIDGNHLEDRTIEYFERIAPCAGVGALLIFDDIGWSNGMERAWRTIQSSAKIANSADLGRLGICVIAGES
jgi:predicted O-methyltransferase YrrM